MEGGCTEGTLDGWRVQGTDGGCSAWLSEERTAVVSGAAPQAEDKDLMTMGIGHCSNLLRPMSESTSSVQNCATQKKEKKGGKATPPKFSAGAFPRLTKSRAANLGFSTVLHLIISWLFQWVPRVDMTLPGTSCPLPAGEAREPLTEVPRGACLWIR